MFKTFVRLYHSVCPKVLDSLRSATVKKLIQQGFAAHKLCDIQDIEGYNSLARTLAFKHPCAAICYDQDSKKLYISFNSHSENFINLSQSQKLISVPVYGTLEEYMRYLHDHTKTQNLIGLVISKSHAYPLLSLQPIPNKLKSLDFHSPLKEKFTFKLNSLKSKLKETTQNKEYSSANEFFFLYAELLTTWQHSPNEVKSESKNILQPLFDVVKVQKLFSPHRLQHTVLDNLEKHHAELAILKYCQENKIDLKNLGIGISKLTCFMCHKILEHYGIHHIGTHGLLYAESNKILDSFFRDEELCKKFSTLLNEYITKQSNLKGIVETWQDLEGIEHKKLPEVKSEYRSESYSLNFSDVQVDLETLGLGFLGDTTYTESIS
jgi:hypothetical protein